jgi:hypothetical protein
MACLLNAQSPQPIMAAPTMAMPIVINAGKVVRSLKRKKPPTKETSGCNERMIVELATVVSFRDPNQRTKCSAKKEPEKNNSHQSFFTIFLNSARFLQTIGIISILANNIRYILKMEAGALDHFTKIAENDIAMIEMVSGKAIDFELSPCFMVPPIMLSVFFFIFLYARGRDKRFVWNY